MTYVRCSRTCTALDVRKIALVLLERKLSIEFRTGHILLEHTVFVPTINGCASARSFS